jgi:putative nucleotidyltransferase with HDIG domain
MREIVSPPATRAALTKLALLFHDIGKPQTAQKQEDGRLSFYGHQSVGRDIASGAFERLRLSNQERELLELLIEEHLRIGFYCNDLPVSNKLIYRYCRKLGDATAMSCLHALADARATRGEAVTEQFLADHEEVANAILWHLYVGKDVAEPVALLTGKQIMELTSLPEGPRVGELKEALLEAQVEGEVRTRQDAERFILEQAGQDQR